jgi:hypothetical protein
MESEIVILKVGPLGKPFAVDRTILYKKIEYFEKMFSGACEGSTSNTATFPEDSVDAFDFLMDWVYTNTIRPLRVASSPLDSPNLWSQILFWKLADKLCIPKLQDQIMDIWKETEKTANMTVYPQQFEEAYKLAPAGSTRRLYTQQTLTWLFLTFPEAPPHTSSNIFHSLQGIPIFLQIFVFNSWKNYYNWCCSKRSSRFSKLQLART